MLFLEKTNWVVLLMLRSVNTVGLSPARSRPAGTVVPSVRPVPWCQSGLKARFVGSGWESIFFCPPQGGKGKKKRKKINKKLWYQYINLKLDPYLSIPLSSSPQRPFLKYKQHLNNIVLSYYGVRYCKTCKTIHTNVSSYLLLYFQKRGKMAPLWRDFLFFWRTAVEPYGEANWDEFTSPADSFFCRVSKISLVMLCDLNILYII